MKSVGQLLLEARIQKNISYSEIFDQTKIPVKILKALEQNNYRKLPSATYIKGFIQNYAQVLGIDDKKILAIFRRDYNKKQKNYIFPKGLTNPLNPSLKQSFKNKTLIGILTGFLFLFIYLGIAIFKLYQPPKLTIFKPKTGQSVKNPVLVKGKTNHDASLVLNGKIINLKSDGNFTTTFNGKTGNNELEFKSTSRRNKITTKTLHIIID